MAHGRGDGDLWWRVAKEMGKQIDNREEMGKQFGGEEGLLFATENMGN